MNSVFSCYILCDICLTVGHNMNKHKWLHKQTNKVMQVNSCFTFCQTRIFSLIGYFIGSIYVLGFKSL